MFCCGFWPQEQRGLVKGVNLILFLFFFKGFLLIRLCLLTSQGISSFSCLTPQLHSTWWAFLWSITYVSTSCTSRFKCASKEDEKQTNTWQYWGPMSTWVQACIQGLAHTQCKAVMVENKEALLELLEGKLLILCSTGAGVWYYLLLPVQPPWLIQLL